LRTLGIQRPEDDVIEMDAPVAHHAACVVEEPSEQEVEPIGVEWPPRRGSEPSVVIDAGGGLTIGILPQTGRADVLEVPGLDPKDLAQLARAHDLDSPLEMG